jgi:hypothetical protein
VILLRHISFGFALLGLILVPLGRPVMGAAADMHAVMGDASAMPMAADMPCCPKKAPTPDCAKDCPLMALCMVGSFLSLPANIVLPLLRMSASLALAGNEPDITGLTHGPPPKPPKI